MLANGNRQGEQHLDFAKRVRSLPLEQPASLTGLLSVQYFQLVGASQSECDTIPGRQCMASCLFLLKQFEDVLVYLNSIQPYCYNSTIFNYNHGVSQAAAGQVRTTQRERGPPSEPVAAVQGSRRNAAARAARTASRRVQVRVR